MRFEYFHPEEAQQYDFYRIPKALLTDRKYRKVSLQAKLLYGELLERMSQSAQKGWKDEDGRIYICLTLPEITKVLQCRQEKVSRLLQELDTEHGIGLIEQDNHDETTHIYINKF